MPLAGDRNLREEEENRPTRCSEPLRYKVGGPSKVSSCCAGWDCKGGMCGLHFQRPPFIQNKPLLEIREHKQVVFNV